MSKVYNSALQARVEQFLQDRQISQRYCTGSVPMFSAAMGGSVPVMPCSASGIGLLSGRSSRACCCGKGAACLIAWQAVPIRLVSGPKGSSSRKMTASQM